MHRAALRLTVRVLLLATPLALFAPCCRAADAPPGATPAEALCRGYAPLWSPDGTQLAYCTRQRGELGVEILDVKSGSVVELPGLCAESLGCWLPDGSGVLAVAPANVQRTELPNGFSVTLADSNLMLAAMSKKVTQLTSFSDSLVRAPTLAAGGRCAVVVGPKLGTPFVQHTSRLSLGPDGKEVRTPMSRPYDGLWLVPLDQVPARLLMPVEEAIENDPDVSPDGKSVVFTRITNLDPTGQRASDFGLAVYDLDGGKMRLLSVEGRAGYAKWSPDGSRLAFFNYARPEEVWTMAPDGTQAKRLAAPPVRPAYKSLTWSRDGKSVLIHGEGDIYALPVDGSDARKLTLGLQMYDYYHFSLHPDGRQIAFTRDNQVMMARLAWPEAKP